VRQITFTVYGRPQPAGSKRAFTNKHTGRVQVVDANAKAKPWKQEITGTAVEAARLSGSRCSRRASR
jgi:hypothetical protein